MRRSTHRMIDPESITFDHLEPPTQSVSATIFRFQVLRCKLDSSCVPIHPQPADNCNSFVAKVRVMPPVFPRMNVGHVHLYEWDAHAEQRIPDDITRVRQSARVDDDGCNTQTKKKSLLEGTKTGSGLDAVHN